MHGGGVVVLSEPERNTSSARFLLAFINVHATDMALNISRIVYVCTYCT